MAAKATAYSYSIQNDFPNRKVATDRLAQEIQSSSIVTALDRIDTSGDDCSVWFKDALSAGDKTTLGGLVAVHSGEPLPGPATKPDGTPIVALHNEQNGGTGVVAVTGRIGKELILVTHNFCDPTTWYTESIRETDHALTDSGDGLTWTSGQSNWIDMTHGKCFDENSIASGVSHGYIVEIKVDGITLTPRAPFATSGGDYTVNYPAGTVTFANSQSGKTVTASYSHENGSTWVLIPEQGTEVDIEDAEAQFSKNVIINDDTLFDVYAYNPADLPNKILYNRTAYKTMMDFINEARGSFPVVPAIGGSMRGTQNDTHGFPFRYGTVKQIFSAMGMEIRVSLRDNQKFDGDCATATFYCVSKASP